MKSKWNTPSAFFLAVGLWMVILVGFFAVFSGKQEAYYPLQGHYSVKVITRSGEEAFYEDGNFPSLSSGDRAELLLRMSDMPEIDNPELYLPLYNVIVRVMEGDQVLHADDVPENDFSFYGNRRYEIPLPANFRDREYRVAITATARFTPSDLDGMVVCPANQAWMQVLRGKENMFCLFGTLIVIGTLFAIFFLLQSLARRKTQIGLPITLFEIFISIWFFCNNGLQYLLVSNTELCAKLEYYALYLAPLPLCGFIRMLVRRPRYQKAVNAVSVIYGVFYLVSLTLEVSSANVNYSTMLTFMHITAGVTVLVLVVGLFLGVPRDKANHISVLRYGVLLALLLGFIELLRFNLVKYWLDVSWISTHGFSEISILIIAITLATYLIMVSSDEVTARIERQQLMILAYRDSLTGIPNRAACFQDFQTMEKEKIRDYTMIFFDLNNLKYANDTFGHEMGDQLLSRTGELLKEVFAATGYVGRWGGDEFIACVYGEAEKGRERIARFRQRMEETDQRREFPFPYSVAIGCVVSTTEDPIEPVEAVRQADDRMYENKRAAKQG